MRSLADVQQGCQNWLMRSLADVQQGCQNCNVVCVKCIYLGKLVCCLKKKLLTVITLNVC